MGDGAGDAAGCLTAGPQDNVIRAFRGETELKALRAHPAWKGRIDRSALALFLRYNCVPAPYSIYEGVAKARDEHQAGTRNWQYLLWDVLMFQAWLASQSFAPSYRLGSPQGTSFRPLLGCHR